MRSREKAKVASVCLALLAAMAVLALPGCQQPGSLSSDSLLRGVTVAGITPAGGLLGTPWTGGTWVEGGWMDVVPGDIYLTSGQLENMEVRVSVDGGAEVWYAVTDSAGVEPWFENVPSFFVERGGGILWIQIFSANLDSVSVYAFNIHNRTPRLIDVRVGRSFTTEAGGFIGNQGFSRYRSALGLGTPAEEWANAKPGELIVGVSELAGTVPMGTSTVADIWLDVALEYEDDVAEIVVTRGNAVPDFENNVVDMDAFGITDLENGDWLNIRVTSDRQEGTVSYYRIGIVAKNDDFTFPDNSIAINGVAFELGNLGHHSLVGQEAWGSYFNGAQLVDRPLALPLGGNVLITATPTAATTTVGFAYTDNTLDYLMGAFTTGNNLGDLPNGIIVAMEVTNELGETVYYRFRIGRGSDDTALTGITVGGVPVASLGTPRPIVVTPGFWGGATISWPAPGVPGEIVLTGEQAQALVDSANPISADGHSGATIMFARGTGAAGTTPPNPTANVWTATGEGLFPMFDGVNDARIYVNVQAENGMAAIAYAITITVAD